MCNSPLWILSCVSKMCGTIPLFFSVMWVVAYTADQSQICQETISMGCASYQPIEADETVCGTDGSRYNNFCEFGVAKCKDPSLDIASLGHCENGQTTVTTTISSTTVTTTISSPPTTTMSSPPTTTMSTTTMTTTPTTTATKPPQTRPPSNNPTTMGPEHDLFCDNKDAIQCPSTVDYVCASDGVLYKNSCEFTKASCSNGNLIMQSMSSCATTTTTGKPTTLDPTQQLFCDNKDFITCPSVVNHVCASNGVVYNNECEFTKVKCTNSALTIQPSSSCRQTF